MSRLLLSCLLLLTLIHTSHAADTDLLESRAAGTPTLRPQTAVEVVVTEPISADIGELAPPTKCQLCMPWFEMILGSTCEALGTTTAAVGVVMLAPLNDQNDPTGYLRKIGIGLTMGGAAAERAGTFLSSRADRNAAEVERLLNEHVRNITTSDLTQEQIDILSIAFYGDSDRFKKFIGCASGFDTVAGVICKAGAIPVGLAGYCTAKFMSADSTPVLILSGVAGAMYKFGEFFGKRAEKRNAQLARIKQIDDAKKAAEKKAASAASTTR